MPDDDDTDEMFEVEIDDIKAAASNDCPTCEDLEAAPHRSVAPIAEVPATVGKATAAKMTPETGKPLENNMSDFVPKAEELPNAINKKQGLLPWVHLVLNGNGEWFAVEEHAANVGKSNYARVAYLRTRYKDMQFATRVKKTDNGKVITIYARLKTDSISEKETT